MYNQRVYISFLYTGEGYTVHKPEHVYIIIYYVYTLSYPAYATITLRAHLSRSVTKDIQSHDINKTVYKVLHVSVTPWYSLLHTYVYVCCAICVTHLLGLVCYNVIQFRVQSYHVFYTCIHTRKGKACHGMYIIMLGYVVHLS